MGGGGTLITQNVRFVTHDGSINIVRRLDEKYKDLMKFGRIEIGENCFIGANSTIMPNVRIGNNSVVAACSCVTKDIPVGEVWGGVLAKRICTVYEYADKLLGIGQLYLGTGITEKSGTQKEVSEAASDAYCNSR